MTWLIPLGFIGLSGLAVLILIYLIKPNFQNRYISSTYVWKLSLKIKRRKNPISKIKNLLIFILQILILVFCSFILARPVIADAADKGKSNEVIMIIDASASMRATDADGTSRFDRAISEARTTAAQTFDDGGTVSVIFAGNTAETLVRRADPSKRSNVDGLLASFAEENACTYGSADIDGAMLLASEVAVENPHAGVLIFTGKHYGNYGNAEIRDVSRSDGSEWNVAVLDVRAEVNKDGAYVIEADVACYGRDIDVTLDISLSAANGNNVYTYLLNELPGRRGEKIRLTGNRTTTVSMDTSLVNPIEQPDKAVPIFSFDTATVSVAADDSLATDNMFVMYGNNKQELKIQYASLKPNSFFSSAFTGLVGALRRRWNVSVSEVRAEYGVPQTSGFDLYVYEEYPMETLPQDGVLFVVNPASVPRDIGFTLMGTSASGQGVALEAGEPHPITANVDAGNIEITRYRPIVLNGESDYVPLLVCDNSPVVVCKNTEKSKIIAMTFSVNYSNIAMNVDFPRLVLNAVNYFIPSTFSDRVYNVNDTVTLTPRGTGVVLDGGNYENTAFTEFPATVEPKLTGTYTVTQTLISSRKIEERFFVRIPTEESNIVRVIDVLGNQFSPTDKPTKTVDLCVYFAAVLLLLIVAERFLYARAG